MTRTFKAHFDGKVFVPDEPVDVPIGKPFNVQLQDEPATKPEGESLAYLADWARTLPHDPTSPGDRAAQHDHYIYGTPKRDKP